MAALVWMTPAQNDTWWHLRSGREILENPVFLDHRAFFALLVGTEIPVHWWLSQIIFYVAFVGRGLRPSDGSMRNHLRSGPCVERGDWSAGTFETRIILLLFRDRDGVRMGCPAGNQHGSLSQ